MPYSSPSELTKLEEEFVDYQLLIDEDIPAGIMLVMSNVKKVEMLIIEWTYYGNIYQHSSLYHRFKKLCRIAKLVLVIPHSNADEERVFSMVRKNKTPFRPSLSLDKSLPSLLTVKLATEEPCHKFEPTSSVIERAGKVTWEYNKEHRRSM